jgi:hypothetical protein
MLTNNEKVMDLFVGEANAATEKKSSLIASSCTIHEPGTDLFRVPACR